MFADAVRWEHLVFDEVCAQVAVSSAGTEEDPVDVRKWSSNRESNFKDAHVLLFREALLVCRQTDKLKFALSAAPVRVCNIVLSPQVRSPARSLHLLYL
jgi:hypothetical protein